MKYLSDYTQDKQTELFNATGTFFAFSNDQFKEGIKETGFVKGSDKIINCGYGMFVPKKHFDTLVDGLDSIQTEAIDQDIKENTIEGIIKRELWNHEVFYTMDYSDALRVLKPYGVTEGQVKPIYKAEMNRAIMEDLI